MAKEHLMLVCRFVWRKCINVVATWRIFKGRDIFDKFLRTFDNLQKETTWELATWQLGWKADQSSTIVDSYLVHDFFNNYRKLSMRSLKKRGKPVALSSFHWSPTLLNAFSVTWCNAFMLRCEQYDNGTVVIHGTRRAHTSPNGTMFKLECIDSKGKHHDVGAF